MTQPLIRALGLMTGTSMDGIDAALVETDGHDLVHPIAFRSYELEADFRERLRACLGNREGTNDFRVAVVERELTEIHAEVVHRFLEEQGRGAEGIDLIGFHGQTIWHQPEEHLTIQLGDGEYLARQTGIPVVNDFRSADIKAGGQGAPLVPLYHHALAADLPKPVAIVNIGGVSNITWIGGEDGEEILAFDMGPGNAMIDDWMLRHTGQPYDKEGNLAALGFADEASVDRFLQHPYFGKKPPKSLDRNAFHEFVPEGLSATDGVATLTMMTVRAIVEGLKLIGMHGKVPLPLREGLGEGYIKETPSPVKTKEGLHGSRASPGQLASKLVFASSPSRGEGQIYLPHIYLTGGGRHNATMKRWIAEQSGLPVGSVDDLGWNGDALEAEAFAYLAVRSKLGLPLSLPGTTGVPMPMTGGVYHEAAERRSIQAI